MAKARLAIENVSPEIDAGRFAAKGVLGREIEITADVFCDGHEVIGAAVMVRTDGSRTATAVPMMHAGNDRWAAGVVPDEIGPHHFTIAAWRDPFGTWHHDTAAKVAAGQDVAVEIEEARLLVAGLKARGPDGAALDALKAALDGEAALDRLVAPETQALMARIGPRANLTLHARELPLWIDRERAAFGAWYELFPRSMGRGHDHGTFDDVIGHLPYVRDLGFDTLYFPPIHPIGRTNRKGRNNALRAEPGDVGSPYAIGSNEGGFRDVHPGLGTLHDFDRLVTAAAEHGLEIALDVALNASPDHPWIAEHPDWFERRPDGTIKHAENPPKKYEDIVNFRYYLEDGPNTALWHAIRDLFLFWADRGVLSFRVDNPHTKPFPFWEWKQTDFDGTPALLGTIEWVAPDGTPTTLGAATAFVRNQGDAWGYVTEALDRDIERRTLAPAAEPGTEVAPEIALGGHLDIGTTLGRRTAALHRALASGPRESGFSEDPLDAEDLARIAGATQDDVTRALGALRDGMDRLSEAGREAARRVLARTAELEARVAGVARMTPSGGKCRIHGDYHLGQVLVVQNDVALIDFEGEPTRPLADRTARTSPLRDVAGMLRSFDYALWTTVFHRIALGADPEATLAAVEGWRADTQGAFLTAYRETMAGSTLLPADAGAERQLLDLFLIQKAAYEIGYELSMRPDRVQIPLEGLLTLLGPEPEGAA